jgi:hypothetical protein
MSEMGAPNGASGAPSSAGSAPAASAPPSSAPASSGLGTNGTARPPGGALNGAPHPPGGAQEAPPDALAAPPRPRFPYKTKIGEQEHEIDLADYRHKVKIDGQEYELSIGDLANNQERLRSSMKRYDEASKIKRDAEALSQRLETEKQTIVRQLKDPEQGLSLLKRALGVERFNEAIVSAVKRLVAYNQMPDDQRAAYDQQTQREEVFARRQSELERREAAIKQNEEQQIQRLQAEREKALLAEWIPALERVGLPAKVNGEPHMGIVRMLARKLREARDLKAPMTLEEAARAVREDYEGLVGHEVSRRQELARAQVESQPGRMDPEPPANRPAPRARPASRMSAAEYERNLRRTWER